MKRRMKRLSSRNSVNTRRVVYGAGAVSLIVLCAAAVLVPRIYSKSSEAVARHRLASNLKRMPGSLTPQAGPAASAPLQARLASEAQADKMRKRLGQRFQRAGREVSVLSGTLTIAGQDRAIQIRRSQDPDGESVAISVQGQGSLTWNGADGVRSNGRPASGSDQKLLERIALDSPDQFVLAQLRGASYYTIATRVVPEEALQSQSYTGPAWDVIRIDEPNREGLTKPESAWRMYYVNSETGLLERIISSEQGQPIMAELLDWTNSQGEMVPARIRWSSNGQVIMELVFTGFSNGPR